MRTHCCTVVTCLSRFRYSLLKHVCEQDTLLQDEVPNTLEPPDLTHWPWGSQDPVAWKSWSSAPSHPFTQREPETWASWRHKWTLDPSPNIAHRQRGLWTITTDPAPHRHHTINKTGGSQCTYCGHLSPTTAGHCKRGSGYYPNNSFSGGPTGEKLERSWHNVAIHDNQRRATSRSAEGDAASEFGCLTFDATWQYGTIFWISQNNNLAGEVPHAPQKSPHISCARVEREKEILSQIPENYAWALQEKEREREREREREMYVRPCLYARDTRWETNRERRRNSRDRKRVRVRVRECVGWVWVRDTKTEEESLNRCAHSGSFGVLPASNMHVEPKQGGKHAPEASSSYSGLTSGAKASNVASECALSAQHSTTNADGWISLNARPCIAPRRGRSRLAKSHWHICTLRTSSLCELNAEKISRWSHDNQTPFRGGSRSWLGANSHERDQVPWEGPPPLQDSLSGDVGAWLCLGWISFGSSKFHSEKFNRNAEKMAGQAKQFFQGHRCPSPPLNQPPWGLYPPLQLSWHDYIFFVIFCVILRRSVNKLPKSELYCEFGLLLCFAHSSFFQ